MNTFKAEVQGRLLNTRTVRAVRVAPPPFFRWSMFRSTLSLLVLQS